MVAGPGRASIRWYRGLVPFGISLPELLILLVVLLLVFGAKRLPEMGKSLGKGMREFKDAVSGIDEPTTPTPSEPAELPPVNSQPTAMPQSGEAEESEREKVS
ncbi:MAG: twin-arginine translocase TatA/TatE family subunit [Actinobacteria bacterium]|nr:MAG: twin-arginine translocase TatA/TatE family subunit [Actinomycetota bacterium]TML47570.1 MAG: twin-arginine translocase TatA/TatE family subunit [Actinomycetota bacterium]TML69035.1 MAG: twin-arginine translocase TatA/TatE family subunit [Actinomycetota bacterium]